MKLGELYQNFQLIQKAYDNCSYKRIFELMDAYKEVEERVKKAEEKRLEIIRKYSNGEDQIPEDKQEEASQEFQKLMDTTVRLKENLKFTQKDLEGSGLKGLEIVRIGNFIVKS